ncbi:MAG: efflux RND transporter periplasmic adaptor subunit [Candidatus Hydrogenedentes bacterium]|nr:efflux RND transporter periplasmic adaptor subunit [Candidatus Hydrogenedentota bacterium]
MAEQKHKSIALSILGWVAVAAAIAAPISYLGLRQTVVNVTVTTLKKGRVEQTVSAISSGTVMAKVDSMVASEFMGKVIATPIQEGDRVTEGDVLVELNHTDLDAQVALAEANLRVGKIRLEQAKIGATINAEVAATQVSQTSAQLDQSQMDYTRIKALRDQKAVSQSDMDKAALALRVSRENKAAAVANQQQNLVREQEVKSTEAAVEQLGAALDVAKAARAKAFIRTPISGIVARRNVDVGESVSMGLPAAQVVQTDECYVEAPFDEANASQVRVGQTARINLDSYRGTDFKGTVTYIAPVVSLNPDLSRTMKVKIRVEEQQDKFVVGMSADVTIIVQEKENVLFAPTEALVRDEAGYVVENGRAVRRTVKVGVGNWATREILDGLKEGDVLITSLGIRELTDGVKVNVPNSPGQQ